MVKKGEIQLYGQIGRDWWTGEGITDKWFAKQLERAIGEAGDGPVVVRINSTGGSVFDGIAIYNQIAQSEKEIHCYVDGVAYSMGAIIALAGNKTYMAKNATLLMHNVSGGVRGNAKDLEGALELMNKLDNSLAESIADKTGMSADEVKAKWMDYRDHTLSAAEAKEAGLADEVLDKAGKVPENLQNMTPAQINAWIVEHCQEEGEGKPNNFADRIVAGILDTIKNILPGQEKPAGAQPIINQNEKKMKFVAATYALLAAVFGVQADAGEVSVEPTAEHLAQLEAALKDQKELKDAQAALAQKEKDLQAKLEGALSAAGKESTGDITKDWEALEAAAKEWGEGGPGGTPPAGAAGDPPPNGGKGEFYSDVDRELEEIMNLTQVEK